MSSSFFIDCFFVRIAGQQHAIKLPHLTVFLHFAWVKFQAIPSKILNVIGLSSSGLANPRLFSANPISSNNVPSKLCKKRNHVPNFYFLMLFAVEDFPLSVLFFVLDTRHALS